MMAAADNFRITVRGQAGHGSMPHQTVDSILTAAQLVVALQSVVSRNLDPLKPGVLSFGTIQGGTVYNIIPEEVRLTGTVRSFDPAVQRLAQTRLREMTQKTCDSFGAEGEVEYEVGYPPVVNPTEMVDFVQEVVRSTLGRNAADGVAGGDVDEHPGSEITQGHLAVRPSADEIGLDLVSRRGHSDDQHPSR